MFMWFLNYYTTEICVDSEYVAGLLSKALFEI